MPGDSLYWSPTEADSDESIQAKEQYIDPWDLENYAYIREHLESLELSSTPSAPSGSSGEFAEANSNSFYYVPGDKRDKLYPPAPYVRHVEERRGYDSLLSDQENYAAIDELKSCDKRRRSDMYRNDRGRLQEEYESEIDEVNPYAEGLVRDNPIFGIYDKKGIFRRVALPIKTYPKTHHRDRSRSFAYGEHEYDVNYEQRHTRGNGQEIYGRLEDYRENRNRMPPVYDDVARGGKKPDNFGFSKYGHLKIDYSCSWNNLNKYMKYN